MYELMIMAVKHQIFAIRNPRHLTMITLNHLDAMQDYTCSTETRKSIILAHEFLINVSLFHSFLIPLNQFLLSRDMLTYQSDNSKPSDTPFSISSRISKSECLFYYKMDFNIKMDLSNCLQQKAATKVERKPLSHLSY